ncbi:diacylglycerol kinase family protein [Pedobacter sp. MW01-1-1]|uniref:diacylglycerol kinase family protein n=1 Tax=Pedobacter sp. MW01-1-1 TaxID=3383027 RepID=UPI003FEF2016
MKKNFSVRDRIKSFKYAFNGLFCFFRQEHNARIHAVAAVGTILLSWYVGLSRMEWVAIFLAISLVIITEILNTAIEKLADAFTEEFHPKIKVVKDLAAGAVLFAAFFALAVACMVFIPKVV